MSNLRIPILDLKAQHDTIRREVAEAIERDVDSQIFIHGPEIEAFERDVAAYVGVRHAIGLSSGTDAILVALMALGIGPGDEVITTPYTFIATCSCIARLGAKAVFVDIDRASFNIDAARVEAAITPRTKAIMPVHLFGQMADVDTIGELGRRHQIPVIEDGAQALSAQLHGKHAGSWGTMGTYSFFPSKNLGGFGDGGMLVTNDDAVARSVRLLRNQGQEPKYFSIVVGGNFRLDALQAAVLRVKLPRLDAWGNARKRNADRYRKLFADAALDDLVELPPELPNRRHVYNQFVLRVRDRDALKKHLHAAGIGTEIYYPQPMHLQKCFEAWGHSRGQFPQSETGAEESLAIPVYPELTEAMQEEVISTIRAFYRG
jgi:dTDP-4-amino-4,6-dideoxygalactose transaminase